MDMTRCEVCGERGRWDFDRDMVLCVEHLEAFKALDRSYTEDKA